MRALTICLHSQLSLSSVFNYLLISVICLRPCWRTVLKYFSPLSDVSSPVIAYFQSRIGVVFSNGIANSNKVKILFLTHSLTDRHTQRHIHTRTHTQRVHTNTYAKSHRHISNAKNPITFPLSNSLRSVWSARDYVGTGSLVASRSGTKHSFTGRHWGKICMPRSVSIFFICFHIWIFNFHLEYNN